MSNQTAFIIFNLLAVVSLGVESLLSLVPCLKGPVIELTTSTREQLEELQLEGDLLEVMLDQTHTIYRILQAASQPPHDALHTLIQVRGRGVFRSPGLYCEDSFFFFVFFYILHRAYPKWHTSCAFTVLWIYNGRRGHIKPTRP